MTAALPLDERRLIEQRVFDTYAAAREEELRPSVNAAPGSVERVAAVVHFQMVQEHRWLRAALRAIADVTVDEDATGVAEMNKSRTNYRGLLKGLRRSRRPQHPETGEPE